MCFRETLDAIVERLAKAGITSEVIHGGQSGDTGAIERETGIARFQADQTYSIIVMIQAGGVGVSLHDLNGNRARRAYHSPTWSAVELRQAFGRVWRAGGKTKSTQRVVFVAGSVEESVRRTVESKLARLDTLNDGDCGKPANVAIDSEGDMDRDYESACETQEAMANESRAFGRN